MTTHLHIFINALLHIFPLFIVLFLFWRLLRPRSKDIPGSPGDRRLISQSSWLLQKFGSSRSYKSDFYFDLHYFYAVNEANTTSVPLANITKVKRETTRISNRYVWSVTWVIEGHENQVRFLHNFTFFNRSFAVFLDAVKKANPSAEISSLWAL